MEDKEIIDLFLKHAEEAIKETANRYGGRTLRLAKNILGSDRDAEECVNDAYYALWNRIPPKEPTSLCAYLLKITRHIALNRLEHNLAACRNPEQLSVLDELAEVLPDDTIHFEENEVMRAINEFLAREKVKNRVMFVRRYFYQASMREIAERMHMQENAVRATLFRTRNKLALHLRAQGIGGDYVKE